MKILGIGGMEQRRMLNQLKFLGKKQAAAKDCVIMQMEMQIKYKPKANLLNMVTLYILIQTYNKQNI